MQMDILTEKEIIEELIRRMQKRKKELWNNPSPYIQPLWEKSEIDTKINQLQKLL
jgi:hypothetical protein